MYIHAYPAGCPVVCTDTTTLLSSPMQQWWYPSMSHMPSPGMCMTARHTCSPAIMYISSIYTHRTHHKADAPSPYAYPSLTSLGICIATPPASHSITLHTTTGGMRQALQSAAIRGRLLPDMRSLSRYGPIHECRLHAFHTPARYITPFDIFLTVLSTQCSYKVSIPLDITLISDG